MNDTRQGKPFTAAEATQNALRQYFAGEIVRKRTVYRKNLSGTSCYEFCPYCMRRLGVTLKDLSRYFALSRTKGKKSEESKEFMDGIADKCLVPLEVVRNKLLLAYPSDKGRWGVVTFETKWACPMCKRELDENDFIMFWAKPRDLDADEKKFINLDNPADLENF